jgi:hypothetical protein
MSTPGTGDFDRNREETLLTEYLIERVGGRALGRVTDECLYNPPHDVYFIGNLRPRTDDLPDLVNEPSYLGELRNKLAPVAFGADFRLVPTSDEVTAVITVSWDCYYRVFPTMVQQREHQRRIVMTEEDASSTGRLPQTTHAPPQATLTIAPARPGSPEDESTQAAEEEKEEQRVDRESPEATETARDRRRSRVFRDSLFIRFRKVSCRAIGHVAMVRDANGEWTLDLSEVQSALDDETARAQQVALTDPDHLRTDGDPSAQVNVLENALLSDDAFSAFVQSLKTKVVPKWKWEAMLEIRQSQTEDENERVLQFAFVNLSPQQAPSQVSGSRRRRDNPNVEPFLFNTSVSFTFDGATIEPFELELAPRGFRYNRELWGRGFNCAIQRIEQTNSFLTTHLPIFEQKRYTTRETPQAKFDTLANDPLPTLDRIATAMEDYLPVWDAERDRYIVNAPGWEAQFGSSFDKDRQQFEAEIASFRRGLALVRDNSDVRLAFQLTNETFYRSGTQNLSPNRQKTAWRLFQIVFLLGQIPGIAALSDADSSDANEREIVDIIYFPTGGGKTEAYLATLVFHCFFDRLRGKSAGVTAWTRFPLRLLTLQQTQRAADVVGMAELVRREQRDERLNGQKIAGFAVGYFVGKEATPNEIVNPEKVQKPKPEDRVFWSLANDEEKRQNWKRVITCPACRTKSVRVSFDADDVRIDHRCTNQDCPFPNGRIPVFVIDNEIYRYLPSVIVGTIDKLASIGNQRKLAQVFGQIDGKCERHGYYKGKCCQKGCENGRLLKPGVPRGVSGPTFFIQDELHLLKEGLGTFDGHYETFAQRLGQRFGQTQPLKVVASSATIEAFERQVRHLYGRQQARVFPGLGPTQGHSFYAQTQDYPQRLFVGLIPHNKTIFNTILELIELYHRTVQDLQHVSAGSPNPYGGSVMPGTSQWSQLLDPYVTSLTYFLASRELDSIRTDIVGDVNPNLESDGYLPVELQDMTGGTSTDDVTRILERLEQPCPVDRPADALLATSMISHGVDVDRLNAMIFYGMPRQTAEYIQASSRVGRSHVGVIFTCLHPARERDQSHYTYFAKYHEFIGQLVEPVAINRWAKFSINRTMPGLFMGVLLQILSNAPDAGSSGGRYYRLEYVKQKISEGGITPDHFIPFLEEAYLVSGATGVAERAFQNEIRARVERYIHFIINARADIEWVSDALIPKPMTSLRDVDETLNIELDNPGTQWAALIGQS